MIQITYLIPRLLAIHQFSATTNEMMVCYTKVTLQTYISSAYIILMKNKISYIYIYIYLTITTRVVSKECLFDWILWEVIQDGDSLIFFSPSCEFLNTTVNKIMSFWTDVKNDTILKQIIQDNEYLICGVGLYIFLQIYTKNSSSCEFLNTTVNKTSATTSCGGPPWPFKQYEWIKLFL